MGATTANDENGLDIISAADVGISEFTVQRITTILLTYTYRIACLTPLDKTQGEK